MFSHQRWPKNRKITRWKPKIRWGWISFEYRCKSHYLIKKQLTCCWQFCGTILTTIAWITRACGIHVNSSCVIISAASATYCTYTSRITKQISSISSITLSEYVCVSIITRIAWKEKLENREYEKTLSPVLFLRAPSDSASSVFFYWD